MASTTQRSLAAMTSRSLWVMKMTLSPCSTRLRKVAKRWSLSCGVSTAVGFVEDEDARVPVHDLQDFEPVAARPRTGRARWRADPCSLKRSMSDRGPARARTEAPAEPTGFGAEHDVFEHGHVVGQGEVLVHHAERPLTRPWASGGRGLPSTSTLPVSLHSARRGWT